jgi:Protein of unknown function, DUF547
MADAGIMVKQEGIMMRWVAIGTLMVLAGCSSVPTSFSPTRPLAPAEFSHQAFSIVVRTYVHDGQVNYPVIKMDRRFTQYLDQLDRVDPNSLLREDRLAFWINAYNAYAIRGILDGYAPGTFMGRYRYFIGRDYRVGGKSVNLYDLERKILIAQFHEPRIHFAIVCASTSCPKLQPWTYEGAQLNGQLDHVAREFINDPTRNHFDREKKIAYLSKIFDWFTEDFEAHAGSLSRYVSQYVTDPDLAQDLAGMRYRIEFLDYNWSLNGTPPK